MGIFDDLGEVADSLLTPIKKVGELPLIGPTLRGETYFGNKALQRWGSEHEAEIQAALLGGGMGFLMGGPFGAAIGAGAGASSAYAAPRAAEALPPGTPDWVRTATEYGIYGVGGGLGLGTGASVAGKVGLERLLAQLAVKSSLEMGALSGVGAAGGIGVAKATGLPEEFGALAGGIGGPVVGPTAFSSLRSRAFRSDSGPLKNLAEIFGANEANSLKQTRNLDTTLDVPLVSTADTIESLRNTAASQRIAVSRYNALDDDFYRTLTGGVTRQELTSGVLEGTQGAQIYTPQFRRELNSLAARNRAVESSYAAADDFRNANADLLAQWPEGKPLADLKEHGGVYYLEDVDKTTHPIPDAVVAAKRELDTLETKAAESTGKLRERLGLGPDAEIPTDITAQRNLLREKVMPNWEAMNDEATKGFLNLSREQRLALRSEADAAYATEQARRVGARERTLASAQEHDDLANFLEQNPQAGAIPPGLRSDAARAYAALRQQEANLANFPRGGYRPTEAMEPLDSYITYAADLMPRTVKGTDLKKQLVEDLLYNDPTGTPTWIDPATKFAVAKKIAPGSLDLEKGTVKLWDAVGAHNEMTVPLDQVFMRYSEQGLASRNEAVDSTLRWMRRQKNPDTVARADTIEARLAKPGVMNNESFDVARMHADRQYAEDAFKATFVPEKATVEGNFFTPEQRARVAQQYRDIMLGGKGWRRGLSKEAAMLQQKSLAYLRLNNEMRRTASFAVNDPEMLAHFNLTSDFDPMKGIIHLGANSVDELRNLTDEGVKLWGSSGQWLRKMAVGESVRHPALRQILSTLMADREASANALGATYRPALQALDIWAAKQMGEAFGPLGQIKQAINVAAEQRSLTKGLRELHPISREGRFMEYAAQQVDWERASSDLKASMKRFEDAHGPERLEEAKRVALSNPQFFLDNPEMFGKTVVQGKRRVWQPLAREPDVASMIKEIGYYDDVLENVRRALGEAPYTLARSQMMQVAPQYRNSINLDFIRQGSQQAKVKYFEGESTFFDLANQVVEAMAGKGKDKLLMGQSRPLSDILVSGPDAFMTKRLAVHDSVAMNKAFDSIKKLSPDVISPDDLVFNGRTWEIRSTNKWPREMRESLEGFNSIVSGSDTKWSGLARISQQIALGNLMADMSLMTLQGFKYLAHSLLTGHLVEGPKNYLGLTKIQNAMGTQTSHILSDWGFYSWMRQNMDEINYLASQGLTGGLKGYIAGPDISKLPLENLPFLGKAYTKIREGDELSFNRLLYYWKVQGVRENLEFAKTMRAIGKDFASRYIDSSPTAKAIKEDMGGLDGYLYGTTEDMVKATVRQVNRSYGGVNMAAEGIDPTRQALEQIMTIVPGFFRAQAGQWASVLTKPTTMEGQLAISMLAREYMFAAGVVSGFAHLMGTQDKINFDDVTKPTWLALPLPDGGHMQIVPTMAIPRMAARSIKNMVDVAQGNDHVKLDTTLEAFAHGRMSPMAGALFDTLHGKDFLGRRYDSIQEKYGMALANTTLPIVVSSFIDDLKEAQKQSNGDFNWMDIAENAGINLMGKGTIPQHPLDKLNTISQGAFGTDWALLTDAEKKEIRKNPAALAAESEYDFYSMRRAGSDEQRVDSAYKGYQTFLDQIWSQPRKIGNFESTQQQDDQMLARGDMPGDAWRERYQARQTAVADRFEALTDELKRAGVNPDEVRQAKMDRLRQGRDPGSTAWLVQEARTEYLGVKPQARELKAGTPQGEESLQVIDWDKFHADREAVLAKYPAAVAQLVRNGNEDQTPGIQAYKLAAQKQQEIETIPRYKGLTAEQGNRLDLMQGVISKFQQSVSSQMGLPAGTSVSGLGPAVAQAAVERMKKLGYIRSEADLQLAGLATLMQQQPQMVDAMRNPDAVRAVLANPDAVIFYPYLRFRVPKQLWNKLPAQVFNSPVIQKQLQLEGA